MSHTDKAELFVPGRLCLFGEHSDWAAEFGLHKGHCLVIGTDQGLSATALAADEFTVETHLPDVLGQPAGRTLRMSCRWDEQALLLAAKDQDEFFRYCAGVAYEIKRRCGVTGGINLQITAMDLPLRKGVSSSAAVCILVAKAFDSVYALNLFPHELMDYAYLGEKLTGSQCGRMDQACIYGKTPVLLTFARTSDIRVEPLFPEEPIYMFFVDLAGRKNTLTILSNLQQAYLKSPSLQTALGPGNEMIVRAAYTAVSGGNAAELGRLMREAQRCFDEHVSPHCPNELASPLLHAALNFSDISDDVYGGKGVGSQGDGTAQFVARSEAHRLAAMEKIIAAFPTMHCFPLNIVPVRPQRTAAAWR